MQSVLQDLKYAWRLLWRSPAFTAAAVVTLALGIGANSAIFSLINVLSLKPLPYREPARVAFVLGWDLEERDMRFNVRLADYVDLQQQSRCFDALAAYSYVSANLTGGDTPERVQAYRVTPNTFAMLGVPAALGRVFGPQDVREGHDDVLILSHGLWQRLFGGDASVLGRRVLLNGRAHEIVGVMPGRFEFPVFNFKGELWVPWSTTDAARGAQGAGESTVLVGRLRPAVPYAAAQAELDIVMGSLATQYPETNRGLGVRLIEMGRLDEEQAGPAVAIVGITAAVVLLLACANVANLLLARGVSRHRELAVRAAVGASRWRIARQLLVEALLLALLGGLAGVVLATLALNALRSALPEALLATMPNVDEIGVDRVTLGYTLALSLVTSVVFGLMPAWRASRPRVQEGLKESAAAGGSRGTRRMRSALVVAEVMLSALLLVAAGLLVRTYGALQRVDPGFTPHGVLTMTLTLPEYKYADDGARLRFAERALDRIASLPGVRSVGIVNVLPFSTYDRGTRMVVEGTAPEAGREPSVSYRVASSGYFEALRIPLVEGRSFDAGDRADGAPVALVNQTLARRFLGGAPPIGSRVRLGRDAEAPWVSIVGVVGDVHHSELTEAPDPELYVPLAQATPPMMMLAIRTETRPEDLALPVRAAIQALDAAQPVYHVKTMEQLVGDSMLPRSTSAALMMLFGALALALSAVGVYGVVAYGVSQRTREFGLRIALGATPRILLALVLRQGLGRVSAGVSLGALGALAASRLMGGMLYGVGSADPLTYASVVGLLAGTGLLACCLPAWRASRVQPVTALRME